VSLGPTSSSANEAAHPHGDVPQRFAGAHQWVLDHWPASVRKRAAIVVVLIAVGIAVIAALARLIGTAIDLGLLAYLGVMVVCWVGAGGALVPVPGTRPLSWVLIVQQSTIVNPVIVALTAAFAMALGQTSFYVATRLEGNRHAAASGQHLPHLHHAASAASGGPAGAPQAESNATPTHPPNRVVAWSRGLMAKGEHEVRLRMTDHPQRIVFVLCMLPNPLTTFATVSAAATGVAFSRFFAASLAGFLVLCTALVIAGQGLLTLLGIS
jgi:membrane protein DedA with SNARE-associated domain